MSGNSNPLRGKFAPWFIAVIAFALVFGMAMVALVLSELFQEDVMKPFVTKPKDGISFNHTASDSEETVTIQVWLEDKAQNPLNGKLLCFKLSGFTATPGPSASGAFGILELTAVSDPGDASSKTCSVSGTAPTEGEVVPLTLHLRWALRDGPDAKARSARSMPPPSETPPAPTGTNTAPATGTASPAAADQVRPGTYAGHVVAEHDGKTYIVADVQVVIGPPSTPTPKPTETAED